MSFIKIETSEGDSRWINLDHVVRATLAHEAVSGEVLLALTFSTDHGRPTLNIHGTDDINRSAIDQIIHALESRTVERSAAA